MTTEQYQTGYEEGYQEGWNAAMDEGKVLSAAGVLQGCLQRCAHCPRSIPTSNSESK